MLIANDDHIGRMRWNTEAALLILQLTSANCITIARQNTAKGHSINVLPTNSHWLQYFHLSDLHHFCCVGTDGMV